MLHFISFLCLVEYALAAASANIGPVYVDPATRTIRDAKGRQVLFHGVNAIYKQTPYIPDWNGANDTWSAQDSLLPFDMENLRRWGMNHMRLGVMWEAVETAPGVYNTTYLDEIEGLINKMGEYGIYTMVDNHQDVLTRLTCGEGIPAFYAADIIAAANGTTCAGDWADPQFTRIKDIDETCRSMDSYNYEKDANGWPLISECNKVAFFKYYTTAEALNIFDAIYNNHNGMTDKFVAFWTVVANKFANNQYVVGFDPINEPALGANFATDLQLLEQGKFDKLQLQPLYEKLYPVYKAANPNFIMYFESAQYPDSGLGLVNNTGFTNPPGGQNNSANHVLNDHTYCCQLGGDICATGEPNVNKSAECLAFHELRVNTREDDAKALGIPLIISEFGACLDSEVCAREITQVGETCDGVLAGWAYWQFKIYQDLTTTAGTSSEGFYNQDGTLQHQKVKALARTYVQLTQGTLKSQLFNTTTAEFRATFQLDTSITEGSQVYMNQEYYYNYDYNFTVFNDETGEEITGLTWDKQADETQQTVHISDSSLNGKIIRFEIVANPKPVPSTAWQVIVCVIFIAVVLLASLLVYFKCIRGSASTSDTKNSLIQDHEPLK